MSSKLTSLVASALVFGQASANLNQLAQAAGKLYFGSATDNSELTDSAYVAILYVFLLNFLDTLHSTPGYDLGLNACQFIAKCTNA